MDFGCEADNETTHDQEAKCNNGNRREDIGDQTAHLVIWGGLRHESGASCWG